jgi:TolA-binding protein
MKKSKAVQKRLEELRVENYKKFCETAKERGIAVVAERVIRRNRDWERIEQIKTDRIEAATRIKKRIAELEQDLADTKDPKERRQIQERLDHWLEKHVALIGLESGLYVQDRKIIGQGENAEAIDFVRIDKAMMDAQLDLETATAKDLGQHRQAVDAVVHVKAYANFDPDEV